MEQILVRKLMTLEVTRLSPDAPLHEAIVRMAEKKHSCTIVTDQDAPLGIITERDLVAILLDTTENPDLINQPCSTFMSSPIVTLNEDESLFDALVVCRAERVRHLPVINDEGQLVGLVSHPSLVEAHFHLIEVQSQMVEKSIEIRTRELVRANEELQSLSMEDHLMEIGNRRAMDVDLLHTHRSALKSQRIYSIALLDIDYFKRYNDCYGHVAGDKALHATAQFIQQSLRKSDRLYRYGGEELLLVLPSTPLENAIQLAQRLVESFAEQNLPHEESPFGCLTLSAGVACVLQEGKIMPTWEALVEAADKGLYQAKETGRNRALHSSAA